MYLYEQEKRHIEVAISDKGKRTFSIQSAKIQVKQGENIVDEIQGEVSDHTITVPIGPYPSGRYTIYMLIGVAGDVIVNKETLEVLK